jgi:hypothetical protein
MNGRHFWQQFAVYSKWSFQALMIPHVLALLIICVVSLAIACVRQRPLRREVWRWSYWLVLTQLLFFPATIAVGVAFPASSSWPRPQANAVGGRWLDILFYVSVATGCFWIYRMKGLRWFAASLVGVQELIVFCAGFIAGMSVSGDWL